MLESEPTGGSGMTETSTAHTPNETTPTTTARRRRTVKKAAEEATPVQPTPASDDQMGDTGAAPVRKKTTRRRAVRAATDPSPAEAQTEPSAPSPTEPDTNQPAGDGAAEPAAPVDPVDRYTEDHPIPQKRREHRVRCASAAGIPLGPRVTNRVGTVGTVRPRANRTVVRGSRTRAGAVRAGAARAKGDGPTAHRHVRGTNTGRGSGRLAGGGPGRPGRGGTSADTTATIQGEIPRAHRGAR